MSRALLALSATLLGAIVAAVACQSLPTGQGCSDLSGNGCPIDRGGSCSDPDCGAIYDCVDGQWVLSQVCTEAGAGGTGGAGASVDGGTEGGACVPLTLDAGPQGFDCTPDLEMPDCPIAAAACANDACFTGCSDFFVCSAGPCTGGTSPCWVDVAYCNDYGQFIVTGP